MENAISHSADEKRHWVRVNAECNNRCMFCLDRDSMGGGRLTLEQVRGDLGEGMRRGARRAIISGGEASIHPQFVEIIQAATGMGYTWVQTITNGRMFCYRGFVERAVAAGLREVTFSMHAHTEELFERLTGVPGSFAQALKGLRNALATPGLVVSVDVVLNGLNVNVLPEIVKFYHSLGVGEFDLLAPVPFGGAWASREEIFAEPAVLRERLQQVFAFAARRGLTVWTNRLKPEMLEGFEGYIQPPEKVFDEVYGRREMFLEYLGGGADIPCRLPERCALCVMEGFCAMLGRMREVFAPGGRGVFAVPEQDAEVFLSQPAERVSGAVLMSSGLFVRGDVRDFLSKAGASVSAVLDKWPPDGGFDPAGLDSLEVEINRETAPALLRNEPPGDMNGAPVRLCEAVYGSLDDAAGRGTSLRTFFRNFRGAAPAVDVPPCVCGGARHERREVVSPDVFTDAGGWSLDALARHYVKYEYFVKRAECGVCAHTADCRGLHVNRVRGFGFSEFGAAVRVKEGAG